MLTVTEEEPEAFASPEQNSENGSNKKKTRRKEKKKNNETLPQPNDYSQPQVKSESLVITPISEIKSNEEAYAEFAKTPTGEIKEKKKKKKKKKSVINGEESNEPKPSLDATVSTEFENKKEVEKGEVYAESGKTQSDKKRKRKSKSETGKMGEVVIVENVLDHDSEQVKEMDRRKRQNSVQDGAQSNEHNVDPAETAVQISVVDREVSSADPTIRLNNQLNSENEHNVGPAETVVQISVLDRVVSQVNSEPLVVTPISEFKSNKEAYAEIEKTQTGEIKKKKKNKKSVINGEESNEHNVVPAETAVQISVVDREVSSVDPTIRLNNPPNNDHNVEPAETAVQISVLDREASQVNSEPLVVTPISEFKSNEEAYAEFEKTQTGEIKKKKKKNKSVINGEESNERNVEPAETAVQISVVDREVSSVDPTIRLNNQPNNEHNVEPAETAVQISVLDREVSQVNSEPLVVSPISEFKSNEEAYAEFEKTQTAEIKKKKKKNKKKKSVINGEESNEHNVEPAETVVQISVVDREVSSVEPTIRLNNQPNNEHNVEPAETAVQISVLDREVSQVNSEPLVVTPISEFKSNEEAYAEFEKTQTGEIKKKNKKKKKKSVINGEESNEPTPSLDTTVSTEFENKKEVEKSEVYAEFAKTQTGEIKKKKKKKSVINGEESNEPKPSLDAPVSTEFENKKEVEKSEVYAEFVKTQTGEIKKKKEKKKKSVINGEESNEPKPSLDAPVSTEFGNKKEVEKSEVYAEFAKTQTDEIKKKKKKKEKKKSVINGEESNEPKPSLDTPVSTEFENKKELEKNEVYAEFVKTKTGEKRKRKSKSETGKMGEVVVVENVLNHDSEQVNEIDRRKRQKSVQDGAQSNEHIVEPAETAVQISVVDREVSPLDPTIRLNNQPANLVEQKDERKIRQEKHLEQIKIAKEVKKIRQEKHLELVKMQKIAKEERKRLKKIRVGDEINKDKMQVKRQYELGSRGEEKTNSGICWACREPNHSIKQCRKLRSLSKDEEICFFCGEIGHSLGKCSVYIAGGGRLARCLFCNLQGHFSYNCPGHGHFQGAVAGGS